MVYLGKPSVVHRIWQDGTSFTSSQAKKDLFRCLARMESLLRLNLPAHPNDNSSWERWRVDAILRVLNTKYEYKILLKKEGALSFTSGFLLFATFAMGLVFTALLFRLLLTDREIAL